MKKFLTLFKRKTPTPVSGRTSFLSGVALPEGGPKVRTIEPEEMDFNERMNYIAQETKRTLGAKIVMADK